MLTRLEVHGFKNLLDVPVDFGPFTCIAGANGIGKSNVFDVIELLSHLASGTLMEAAQQVRSVAQGHSGDPRDLFWDGHRERAEPMEIRLAAEMIVPGTVEDDLGSPAEATTTFLRYEIGLGYEHAEGAGSIGRLVLRHEELHHITRREAARRIRFPHSAKHFRSSVLVGQRRGGPFLSTGQREGGLVVNVHGDGGSFGRPQPRAADRAGRTVLSTITTNDHPTILAARREMQSWRRLALEPSALRAPDSFADPRSLGSDGRHLAATLFRIARTGGTSGAPDPEAVYAEVAGRLSDLGDVGVRGLEVEPDEKREVLTLFLDEQNGLRLPARALSEGTLRFLALCVLLEDPTVKGVICMEEPENGIHPANLESMLDLVRDLAVNPAEAPDTENPFRQVIVNTHSPGVVQLCDRGDILVADTQLQTAPDGSVTRALSLLPLADTWRAKHSVDSATEADLLAYLAAPAGAQLRVPFDLVG